MKHFNGLTPAEAERLAILFEECAEVIQVVGKILRHGYESVHPNGGMNNRRLLEEELGHVEAAIVMMTDGMNGGIPDLSKDKIEDSFTRKLCYVEEWMHHNKFVDSIEQL